MGIEEFSDFAEDIVKKTSAAILKGLKGNIKKDVMDVLRDSFAPIANDYILFRPPISDLDNESSEFWINKFISLAEQGYDKSIDDFRMTGSSIVLNLSFLPSDELGFNVAEDASDRDLGWVFFYTSGLRNLTYFISSELLLDMRSFLENKGFSNKSSQIELIDEGLRMTGEFGDGFLLTPGEFNRVTEAGISWSDLFTDDMVTPPSNTGYDENFLETASVQIEKVIRKGIEEAQLSIRG